MFTPRRGTVGKDKQGIIKTSSNEHHVQGINILKTMAQIHPAPSPATVDNRYLNLALEMADTVLSTLQTDIIVS